MQLHSTIIDIVSTHKRCFILEFSNVDLNLKTQNKFWNFITVKGNVFLKVDRRNSSYISVKRIYKMYTSNNAMRV